MSGIAQDQKYQNLLKMQALALKLTITHTLIIQSHLTVEFTFTYSNESTKQDSQKCPCIVENIKLLKCLKTLLIAPKLTILHNNGHGFILLKVCKVLNHVRVVYQV